MTDAQVPNEHFLVLINDLLASGEVPDLFPEDETSVSLQIFYQFFLLNP